jgi:hypothetical protein
MAIAEFPFARVGLKDLSSRAKRGILVSASGGPDLSVYAIFGVNRNVCG